MRRARVVVAGLAVAVAAVAIAGCAWLDDGPPTRSCRSIRVCFTAQGEVCDPVSQTCVTVDAAAAAEPTP